MIKPSLRRRIAGFLVMCWCVGCAAFGAFVAVSFVLYALGVSVAWSVAPGGLASILTTAEVMDWLSAVLDSIAGNTEK